MVVNARPTLVSDGPYEKIANLFDSVDQEFPGAVWSLSIGWGCDALVTATDLRPVQSALTRAQSHGTTVFDASGDTAGLECKGGQDYSSPPGPDDIGLDAVASLPAVTSVGGTTLSTDAAGNWLAEQAWVDSPQSLGTSGGVSRLFPRPAWQRNVSAKRDPGGQSRLTPDVSAVADPFTGVRIRFDGQDLVCAGTTGNRCPPSPVPSAMPLPRPGRSAASAARGYHVDAAGIFQGRRGRDYAPTLPHRDSMC